MMLRTEVVPISSSGNGEESKPKRNGSTPSNRKVLLQTSSTLQVPGSLFISTGLGMKKPAVWVPRGGTAKRILESILSDGDGDGDCDGDCAGDCAGDDGGGGFRLTATTTTVQDPASGGG